MGQKKHGQDQSEISFTISDISSIITMLKENDFYEFCLEKGSDRLWLKRGTEPSSFNLFKSQENQDIPTPKEGDNVVKLPVQVAPTEVPQAVVVPAAVSNAVDVKSPMVGTFYRRPAVDAEAYVEIGDSVKKGDVLCIIEAMKIMNEIEAEISGKVVDICLNDGQMAEYEEVLFRIEPNS